MSALFKSARGRANLFARFILVSILAGLGLPCIRASAAGSLAKTAGFLEQEVIPDDGIGNDAFGYGAAISGSTAMVGEAHATIEGRNAQGEVYVYRKLGRQWVLVQKLFADDGVTNDQFGLSIALEGNTAIIGAIGVNDSRGAVYIFTNSGGTWIQTQKLMASDGQQLDWFGFSVGISGTHLIVGARNAQSDRGAAYFYDSSSGTWVLTAELTPGDLQPQDYFGNSVAISGNTALVGAFDINGHTPGSAYVFNNFGNTWIQRQKLTPSDGEPDDWFGFAVALDGTTAAIGSSQARINGQLDQGAVYIFNKVGRTWMQRQKLVASDGTEFDAFGWHVRLKGDVLLIGATEADEAYFFMRSNGAWSETAQLMASDGQTGTVFGWTVDFDGRTALITAPFTLINGTMEGVGYFYTRQLGLK